MISLLKNRGTTGQQAENLAEKYLNKAGYKTLVKNFNSRYGEIDLVMTDQSYIVFVEVRYRKNNIYGSGADTVTKNKQTKIIRTAQHFLQQHHQLANQPARFDVISVSQSNGKPAIDWIKNAFC